MLVFLIGGVFPGLATGLVLLAVFHDQAEPPTTSRSVPAESALT